MTTKVSDRTLQLVESTVESFRALELSNGLLSLCVLPELGAKVYSLRDLRNAREWLWRSERIPLGRQGYGTSYVELADTGGWDECFPTVALCKYPLAPRQGMVLPDHGDLWSQAWTTTTERYSDRIELSTAAKAVALPCEFTRTMALPADAARLTMQYEVRNVGNDDVAFIWSAHPLLRIEPGMRLELPATARFNVYSAASGTQLPARQPLSWPVLARKDGRDVSLDPLPGRDAGIAFKIWSDPLAEGWAALTAADGVLRMSFDVAEIPQIALWLNAGGWSGIGGEPYYNLALEPCIGAQDSLEEAVTKYGEYALLRAGEVRRWKLTVELQSRAQ